MIEIVRRGGPQALRDVAAALHNMTEADFVALIPGSGRKIGWKSFAVGNVESSTPLPARLTNALALGTSPRLFNNWRPHAKQGDTLVDTWLTEEDTVACAVVPVVGPRGGSEAALFVGFRRKHRFEHSQQEVFELFARIVGLLIGRQEAGAVGDDDAAVVRDVEATLQRVGGVQPAVADEFPRNDDVGVVSLKDYKRRRSMHHRPR